MKSGVQGSQGGSRVKEGARGERERECYSLYSENGLFIDKQLFFFFWSAVRHVGS